jgi:hypothetical protein
LLYGYQMLRLGISLAFLACGCSSSSHPGGAVHATFSDLMGTSDTADFSPFESSPTRIVGLYDPSAGTTDFFADDQPLNATVNTRTVEISFTENAPDGHTYLSSDIFDQSPGSAAIQYYYIERSSTDPAMRGKIEWMSEGGVPIDVVVHNDRSVHVSASNVRMVPLYFTQQPPAGLGTFAISVEADVHDLWVVNR